MKKLHPSTRKKLEREGADIGKYCKENSVEIPEDYKIPIHLPTTAPLEPTPPTPPSMMELLMAKLVEGQIAVQESMNKMVEKLDNMKPVEFDPEELNKQNQEKPFYNVKRRVIQGLKYDLGEDGQEWTDPEGRFNTKEEADKFAIERFKGARYRTRPIIVPTTKKE